MKTICCQCGKTIKEGPLKDGRVSHGLCKKCGGDAMKPWELTYKDISDIECFTPLDPYLFGDAVAKAAQRKFALFLESNWCSCEQEYDQEPISYCVSRECWQELRKGVGLE